MPLATPDMMIVASATCVATAGQPTPVGKLSLVYPTELCWNRVRPWLRSMDQLRISDAAGKTVEESHERIRTIHRIYTRVWPQVKSESHFKRPSEYY